jgi:hypothetical protein
MEAEGFQLDTGSYPEADEWPALYILIASSLK